MPYENELFAVHGLNQYLWSELSRLYCMKPDWYISAIGNKAFSWIPIMPTQQVGEFTQSTDVDKYKAPFIVYNWRTETIPQNWFIQSDQIVYVIYSQNPQHIRDVTKTIVDLCKKWDESAAALNKYLAMLPNYFKFQQYHYKNISVVSAPGPDPSDEEGGRMESVITIRVTYTDQGR